MPAAFLGRKSLLRLFPSAARVSDTPTPVPSVPQTGSLALEGLTALSPSSPSPPLISTRQPVLQPQPRSCFGSIPSLLCLQATEHEILPASPFPRTLLESQVREAQPSEGRPLLRHSAAWRGDLVADPSSLSWGPLSPEAALWTVVFPVPTRFPAGSSSPVDTERLSLPEPIFICSNSALDS